MGGLHLHTGSRGCLSCHTDLVAEAQKAGPITHAVANFGRGYGKEVGVQYCMDCHNALSGGLGPKFAEAIHGIHKPDKGFTGDCFSCHIVTPQGKFVLWDIYKYDASVTSGWPNILDKNPSSMAPLNTPRDWLKLRKHETGFMDGFTIDTALNGTMAMDQSKQLKDHQDQYMAINYGLPKLFMPKNMKDYTVTVTGPMVKQTKVFTLDELRKMKMVSKTFTRTCAINPPGGIMIYNATFTGVPTMDVLNEAGLKDGANYILVTSYDGWQSHARIDTLATKGAQLTLKMFGKYLEPGYGGPVVSAVPGAAGGESTMWVKTIEVMHVDEATLPPLVNQSIPNVAYVVNSGFLVPARDGTVVGKTATIEGWAYAWNNIPVSRVSLSADNGQTWKDFEVPKNLDNYQWVNWKFTWKAPKAGVYLIKVKAYADSQHFAQAKEDNLVLVVK